MQTPFPEGLKKWKVDFKTVISMKNSIEVNIVPRNFAGAYPKQLQIFVARSSISVGIEWVLQSSQNSLRIGL